MLVFTVSQINHQANELLGEAMGNVAVTGEIRGLVRARSGHVYFKLADQHAQIDCAFFKSSARFCQVDLQEDLQVIVTGRLGIYEQGGRYQLIVRRLEPAGDSELAAERERIRKKLAAEGLFDQQHKKPIPTLARRIAVISSPSGAAIADVKATLARRLPAAEVVLFPVLVQGDQAATQICSAIAQLDPADFDLALIVRGGGSISELWVFNEEPLLRAVFQCPVPIISGVGHESDQTLIELVADFRAATPTAAAELATPITADLMRENLMRLRQAVSRGVVYGQEQREQHLDRLEHRLRQASPQSRLQQARSNLTALVARLSQHQHAQLAGQRQRLKQLGGRLQQHHPGVFIRQMQRRLGPMAGRLQSAWRGRSTRCQQQLVVLLRRLCAGLGAQILQRKNRLLPLKGQLQAYNPTRMLAEHRHQSRQLGQRVQRGVAEQIKQQRQRQAALNRTLHALGPERVLKRGYSIVTDVAGEHVLGHTDALVGQLDAQRRLSVRLRLADGQAVLGQATLSIHPVEKSND